MGHDHCARRRRETSVPCVICAWRLSRLQEPRSPQASASSLEYKPFRWELLEYGGFASDYGKIPANRASKYTTLSFSCGQRFSLADQWCHFPFMHINGMSLIKVGLCKQRQYGPGSNRHRQGC